MEKTMELKMLLESSLKRIFQATVTDILVSVEQTLSEYQGTIQTIQTENEGLKRLLSAQRSAESLHEGLLSSDGSEEDAAEHSITSTHSFLKVSKCSNDKTTLKNNNDSKLKESVSCPPLSLQTDQLKEELCVDKSSRISVPVKTEPDLEDSGEGDLTQPCLNQTVKLVKNESSEVTVDAFTDVQPLCPSRPKYECREIDHSDKITVVSKGYTQDGHFIKIEEEKEAETLPGSGGDSLSQPELKQNNSPVVAEENTKDQSSNLLHCPTCPKTFSRAPSLNTHIKTHSKNKEKCCSLCGKSFRWACELIYHKYIHTGERPYACNICSKTYTHPRQLKMHKRTHTGEKPHACSYCGKNFHERNQLKAHLRTHTGEKPYRCQQCSKTFNKTGNLKRHMKTHTGERPHCCTQCGKGFGHQGALKLHYRIHTGERPYSCKQCRKTFSLAGALKTHMRVHTGERPYSCNECGKKFSRSGSLKYHLKTHK
ncbi:uncharacterized protein V3H82_026223 isoform 1-T1 [Fundulus diaphanus]